MKNKPSDGFTIDHVDRETQSDLTIQRMGIFTEAAFTDQPIDTFGGSTFSSGVTSSSSSSSTEYGFTSGQMPTLPQNGRIHLRNGLTQNIYALNQVSELIKYSFFKIPFFVAWYAKTSNKSHT